MNGDGATAEGPEWRVVEELGGAMGRILVLLDPATGEKYAAKTFKDELFARDPAFAQRFREEAAAWIKLDRHPNIVAALGVSELAGLGSQPYLFMEYVSGGTLAGPIGSGRLRDDLVWLLRLGIECCDGLAHAAAHGIRAHRDLKPENCLLTGEGALKVSDFGLSSLQPLAEAADEGAPPAGQRRVVGTYPYIAPEQWENADGVDSRADVYSLGVMLFYAATGRLPFIASDADVAEAVRRRGLSSEALGHQPMLRALAAEVFERLHRSQAPPLEQVANPRLRAIVERCLTKDPAARPDLASLREQLAEAYRALSGQPASEPVAVAELSAEELNEKGADLSTLGRHREALTWLDRAIELDPSLVAAWLNRGNVYAALEDDQQALADYEQAKALDPSDPLAWGYAAGALFVLGRRDEGFQYLDRALELDRDNAGLWQKKGICLLESQRPAEALECLERANEIDPNNWFGWLHQGVALSQLGRTAEALGALLQAARLNPYDAGTWRRVARLQLDLGQVEAGAASASEAVRIDGDLSEAWVDLAEAYLHLGRWQEAQQAADAAIGRDQNSPQAWAHRGTALRQLGWLDAARESLDWSAALDPDVPATWTQLIALYWQLERWDEVLRCCDQLLRLWPQYAQGWSDRAMALFNLGRRPEACASSWRAWELGYQTPDAAQRIRWCMQSGLLR